jgi:hypothetical protein
MQNISKYMELKDWNKNTFIDLGSGNGRTLAYAILNGFKEANTLILIIIIKSTWTFIKPL